MAPYSVLRLSLNLLNCCNSLHRCLLMHQLDVTETHTKSYEKMRTHWSFTVRVIRCCGGHPVSPELYLLHLWSSTSLKYNVGCLGHDISVMRWHEKTIISRIFRIYYFFFIYQLLNALGIMYLDFAHVSRYFDMAILV